MMQFKTRLTTSNNLINLTPLVDVIFLLLIFFIISSDILPLKSLHVEHPTLEKESSPLTTQLLIIMDAQQVIYLGHQKEMVDLYSLRELLKERVEIAKRQNDGAEPTIVLSVDRRADYGAFLRLFSIAQECGSSIRLVYRNEGEQMAYAEN